MDFKEFVNKPEQELKDALQEISPGAGAVLSMTTFPQNAVKGECNEILEIIILQSIIVNERR